MSNEPQFVTRSARRARQYARHPRWLGWAIRNRWHGYKFGPIRRHRCCDHTTPAHYVDCANHE